MKIRDFFVQGLALIQIPADISHWYFALNLNSRLPYADAHFWRQFKSPSNSKGYLRVSPLFYGFYSNDPYLSEAFKYPLPLAYFLAAIFVFGFSLFIILRRSFGQFFSKFFCAKLISQKNSIKQEPGFKNRILCNFYS